MAGEDRAYCAAVRALSCLVCGTHSGVQAHHAGQRGMSQRAHDHSSVPLCLVHHAEWHGASGWCKGWDKTRRREWAAEAITATLVAVNLGLSSAMELI
jgi:hypothetical protein